MTSRKFIAIDGDDVGNLLRDRIIANDVERISALSTAITVYFGLLQSRCNASGCEIVFCAGDSLLAKSEQNVTEQWLQELPSGPCTVSVGLGDTPETAYLALQLAKARGKNQAIAIDGIEVRTLIEWHEQRQS